jgi:hypothetical protein
MSRTTRTRAQIGAVCSAALLVLAVTACTRPGTGSGAAATGSYVQQVNAQGTKHWTCTSQGLGGNMEGDQGPTGGVANPAYAGQTKGTLSLADCKKNAQLFDKALAFAMKYPTKGTASAMPEAVQFVKGLGTHNMTGTIGGPSGNPFFLQYDGEAASAPLGGMSWFTFSASGPPPGFAGNNDFWHSHASLCYTAKSGLKDALPGAPGFGVAANEISDAECKERGGVNMKLPGIWMAHAWIVPGYEHQYDVFSGASNCMMGKGVKPAANDPCHFEEAQDMEHGGGSDHNMPMPTTTRATATTARPGVPTTKAPTPTTRRAATTTTMASMPGMDHGDHAH